MTKNTTTTNVIAMKSTTPTAKRVGHSTDSDSILLCGIVSDSDTLPMTFPQTIIDMESVHTPLVGTSIQVTDVWLVVVGQLPQFTVAML